MHPRAEFADQNKRALEEHLAGTNTSVLIPLWEKYGRLRIANPRAPARLPTPGGPAERKLQGHEERNDWIQEVVHSVKTHIHLGSVRARAVGAASQYYGLRLCLHFSLTLQLSLLRRSTHILLVAEHVFACRCEQEPTVLLNRDGSVRATSIGGRNIRSAKTWQNPAHPVIPTGSSSLSMSPTRQRAQPARVTPPSSRSGGPSGLPPVMASINSSIGTSPGPRCTAE